MHVMFSKGHSYSYGGKNTTYRKGQPRQNLTEETASEISFKEWAEFWKLGMVWELDFPVKNDGMSSHHQAGVPSFFMGAQFYWQPALI